MRFPFPALLAGLLAGCSSGAATGPRVEPPPVPPCTFTNPIATGQDPWVVRHDGWYYLVESRDRGIFVHRSRDLTDLKKNGMRVWSAPPTGWNQHHVWAPEMHFLDGRWYIYYAAGEAGPPFIHQRSGVLESAGADPQGPYTDRGQLYTGDDLEGGTGNVWSIDLTVERLNGRLYAVWSGWAANAATDRTPQHLYIAEMANPWTVGSNRVRIASPEEAWERGTELDLLEGPQFLRNGEHVFLVYSARESWLRDYRLGQLRLRAPDADPLDPQSWVKSGPVFTATSTVFGVGHPSFTTSPDGSENWIVYHAKINPTPGWERVIRAQKFTWRTDGTPSFGEPVPSGQPIPVPAGQCSG